MASNQLTEFKGKLDGYVGEVLAPILPEGVTRERFVQITMTAVQKEPALLGVNRDSLYQAIRQCALDGFTPDGRQAAVVIFGKSAVYMPMIQGVLSKLRASKAVATIYAAVAYEADRFEVELGSEPRIIHHPYFGKDPRGEVVAAYATATLPSGDVELEVMREDELQAVRNVSRSQKGPWSGPFANEMRKKTVLRRLAKRLTLPDEVRAVIERDDALYDLDLAAEPPKSERRSSMKALKAQLRPEEPEDEAAPPEPSEGDGEPVWEGEMNDDLAEVLDRIENAESRDDAREFIEEASELSKKEKLHALKVWVWAWETLPALMATEEGGEEAAT